MLNRVKLKEVRLRHKALLQGLSGLAKADVPQEIKALIIAQTELEKLSELDALSDYLSADYIQSIRDDLEISQLQVQIKQKVLDGVFEKGELLALLDEAASLNADLGRLESTVNVIDTLKKILQDGIKAVLNAYYVQQKRISEDAIAGIQAPKRFFSRELSLEQKEQKKAKLIAQPKEDIHALFSEEFPTPLMKDKLLEMYLGKMQLCFSNKLDEMSLTDLVQYANKIIQVTNLSGPFLSLTQEKVGDQIFSNYFNVDLRKKDCIAFVVQQKVLIDRDEKEFETYISQLEKHEANKGKEAVKIRKKIDRTIIPAAVKLNRQAARLKEKLLQKAGSKNGEGKAKYSRTQRELDLAEKNIEAIKTDNRMLVQLLQQQESLLKSAQEMKAYRQHQEAIDKNGQAIATLRKKIVSDVEEARHMMAVTWDFLEKSQWFHGKRFQDLKDHYKTKLIPRHDEAVKAASEHRMLDAAEREFADNLKTEKENFELQEKQRRAEEEKSVRKAPAREKELKNNPELTKEITKYRNVLIEINKECAEIEQLSEAIVRLGSQVDASSKGMETKTLSSLQIMQTSLSQFSKEFQDKKEQLRAGRIHVEQTINKLNANLKGVSSSTKKTKNYKEVIRQFDLEKMRFNRPGTDVAGEIECQLPTTIASQAEQISKLISEKQSELIDNLITIFNDIFSEDNLKNFWRKQVSYPGRMLSAIDGAKVKVRNERGVYKPIAVPRGIYMACTQLSPPADSKAQESQQKSSNEKIAKNICLGIKGRLAVDAYGRTKQTNSVYSAIAELLDDNNRLVLTEKKLQHLEDQFSREAAPGGQRPDRRFT